MDDENSSTHTREPKAFPDTASTTGGTIHESSGTTATENQSTQGYSPVDSLSMDAHEETEGKADGPPHPDMAAAAALITAAVSSASASFINPSFFSGTANEDAKDWWTYLENWIRYKNLNAERQQRLFLLLFRAQAASWFESLDDNQKDTFEHLQTAFRTRYFPNHLSRWQTMSDMWTRKQTKSETVDEYVTALMKMGRIANVEDRDVQRYAIIKGLLPDIRRHVLQQNTKDLAAVIAAAKVAEQSMTDEPPEFIMTVNRLENKLDAISLQREPNTSQTQQSWSSESERNTRNRRSLLGRSQSGAMPLYNRTGTPPPFTEREPYNERDERHQPGMSNSRSNQRYRNDNYLEYSTGDNRQYQNNYRFPSETQRPSTRGIIRQSPARNLSENQRKRVSFDNYNHEACQSCGLSNHRTGTCRVRTFYCYNCDKLGHLSRVCQSGRRDTQSCQHRPPTQRGLGGIEKTRPAKQHIWTHIVYIKKLANYL